MDEELDPLKEIRDFYKKYNAIESKSHYVRGYIISEVILLERLIDDYISRYLTTETHKIKFIKEIILGSDKINFENKRQILHQILKTNNGKFLNEHPTFVSDISYLIEKRNNVAHLLLDITNGKIENIDKLSLQKHRNTTTEVLLDENEIQKIDRLIKDCTEKIVELIRVDFNYDYYGKLRNIL